MGWIVGALLERRWLGLAGFALILLGSLLPIARPARGSIVALGAVLLLASVFIAARKRRRGQTPTP